MKKLITGTFVSMAESHDLGLVEVNESENQIIFTNKDQARIFEAGMMPDPDLARMLKDSGAEEYSGEILKQTSPIVSFLINWLLPIAIFVALGQYMSKKLMQRTGGPNAMSFGKSNAKVYVQVDKGHKV